MKLSTLIAVVALVCAPVAAQEIKGLKLGMTEAEVQAAYPYGFDDFTVAGVKSMRPMELRYDDGALVEVAFYFNRRDFPDILMAVREKYPELECSGRMARFCKYRELSMLSDLGVGRIGMLMLRRNTKAENEAAAARKADL